MNNERKTTILQKFAEYTPYKKLDRPDKIKKIFGTIGEIGRTAGSGLDLSKTIREMMRPKPSMWQELLGKGGIGRKALAVGGLAAAVGAGATGAEKLMKSLHSTVSKKRGFQNMMEENPGLKAEPPRDVQRIYNTLHRFSPKMARDPLVAGSFLKRSLQFREEGIQPQDVKTLSEVSKNFRRDKGKPSILQDVFKNTASKAAMDL